MKRTILYSVQTILVMAIWSTPQFANAQLRPNQRVAAPVNPPAVSPYLNLLRTNGQNSNGFNNYGNNVANNYFNLVQPQIQFNNDIAGLQQQTQVLGTGLATTNQLISTGLGVTGNTGLTTGAPSMFMNYSTFYPGMGTTGRGR